MVISRDSLPFRYHAWLRRQWHLDAPPARTSLCPFFQTTLWLSVATLIFAPLIVMGWGFIYFERVVWWILDRIACNKRVSKFLTDCPFFVGDPKWNDAQEAPVASGLASFFLVAFSTAVIVCAIGVICFLGFQLALHGLPYMWHQLCEWVPFIFCVWFPQVPSIIWAYTICLAAAIFDVCCFIGLIVEAVRYGVVYASIATYFWAIAVFTNGPMWMSVLYYFCWVVGLCAASAGIGFGSYWLSKTKLATAIGTGFGNWIERRARCKAFDKTTEDAKAKARRKVMEALEDEPAQTKKEYKPSALRLWVKGLMAKEVNVAGNVQKLFTPMGLAWEWAKAFKHGVCPLIDFVNPDEIEIIKNPLLKWTVNDQIVLNLGLLTSSRTSPTAKTEFGSYHIYGEDLCFSPNTGRTERIGEFDNPTIPAEVHYRKLLATAREEAQTLSGQKTAEKSPEEPKPE